MDFTDKLHTDIRRVDITEDRISEKGQEAVKIIIIRATTNSLTTSSRISLYGEIDWRWKVTGKGPYVGTLPKRIGKLLYKRHGIKLSSDVMAEIGTAGSMHASHVRSYYMRFDRTFEWQRGTFGDRSSCFFTCRDRARESMRNGGCWAVQMFTPTEDSGDFEHEGVALRGLARAWMKVQEDDMLIWNGYGLDTREVAKILAEIWGLHYAKVRITDNDQPDGLVWINDDGKGYILTERAEVCDGEENYDLMLEPYHHCDNCESESWWREDEMSPINGHLYCPSCMEVACECEECDEFYFGDAYELHDGTQLCPSCYERLGAFFCYQCNQYFLPEDRSDLRDEYGFRVCNHCAPNYVPREAEEREVEHVA